MIYLSGTMKNDRRKTEMQQSVSKNADHNQWCTIMKRMLVSSSIQVSIEQPTKSETERERERERERKRDKVEN